ncbi:MAG: hypothetical protein AAF226_13110, partial [Verrucomicrobiota bacterium]
MADKDDENDKNPNPQQHPFGDPEELTRRLSEMFKTSFGDSINMQAFTQNMNPFATDETGSDDGASHDVKSESSDIFDFDWLPRDIKAHLDRYVIKQ